VLNASKKVCKMEDKDNGQLETATESLVTNQSESVEPKAEIVEDKTVSYGSHKKLLNQHKHQKAELEELRSYKQRVEEEKALEKGEYEKVLKTREEELQNMRTRFQEIEQKEMDTRKIQAVLNQIPGQLVKPEYLSHVDLDAIAVDPDTKEPDSMGVEMAVGKFIKEHPTLFVPKKGKTLPVYNAPNTPSSAKNLKSMSREELKEAFLRGNFKE